MLTGEKFGRYEIRTQIGAGGMGEVYIAFDEELGRNVAVKILPSEFSRDDDRKHRFRQEARAASALNHPNIITIYEIGENDWGSFLITELIDGETLRETAKRERLPMLRILKIVEQVANALVAAHGAHIVHRDIKPENIMVRLDGIVKVLDFGLAKPTAQENADDQVKTLPGMVMGSVRYMSPEQARGHDVDERTDIWSLGVVLYELLAGRAPFDGATTSDTIAAVIYKEPEPVLNFVRNAPAELQRIIRKALQKDREERYQHIKDFALDIKDLIYELEHATSGERRGTPSTDIDLSENPTMIHQTHSTQDTALLTSGIEYSGGRSGEHIRQGAYVSSRGKKHIWKSVYVLLGTTLLLFAAVFGFYKWFDSGRNFPAFEKTQVSRLNSDGKVLLPAISPDGKYIAYASGETGNRSLVVREISNDSIITVVQPTNLEFRSIVFSPTGDYIYYTQMRGDFSINTLYQVPKLGGTSKKLIEDVDSAVTFSPDGKQLAFMRVTSRTNENLIFTADVAGTNLQQVISTKQTDFDFFSARPAWSPDGTKILIGAGKRQGGFSSDMKVAEISLAEKSLKTIETRDWFSVGNFTWFKDGSGFLFAGRETPTSPVQIWRASYPDVELTPVTNDFNDYTELGLSGDGKTIVTLKGDSVSSLARFSPASKETVQMTTESRTLDGSAGIAQMPSGSLVFTRSEGKKTELWVSEPDGKNARAVTADSGFVYNPQPTADGRYIVFGSQNPKSSRIWRMDPDGKNLVRLTEENPNNGDFIPQVTPDGKTIIIQRFSEETSRTTLLKMPIEGGAPVPFYAEAQYDVFQPRISPDGKRIVFTIFDIDTFERKIRVATLNGDTFGQVEKDFDSSLINTYQWSPDGKSLTVLSNQSGAPNLWRLPLDGSPQQPITDFKSGRISNFAWSRDGKSVFLVRGIVNNDLILIRDTALDSR